MPTVTLLGPQVREPNLSEALRLSHLKGPFVSISAGWQEREGEIDELKAHVDAEVQDLGIYALTEDIFSADRELRQAHRERQARLQEMQDLYSLQLAHAKSAARELFVHYGAANAAVASNALRAARRQAISSLRRLDRAHLAAIQRQHLQFERALEPASRPSVRQALTRVRKQLAVASAVLIAGGHVAVLINRLRLLGGNALFGGHPVVAWSAGAMAIAESIVLYHDHPPQGAANAEVFETGLGLIRGVIPLPHAQSRLALHDSARIALFARRFAPSACLTLDTGACLHFDERGLRYHSGSFQLGRKGSLDEIATRSRMPEAR